MPAIEGGIPIRTPDGAIPFGLPSMTDAEIAEVAACLRSGWIGPGPRVQRFEREFAAYKGAPHAIAVSSGTAALQLALFGLGIGPGDEVIAPTMTFAPSLHSILHAGARLVLADCRPDTFTIDPEAVESLITSRTKAILVVHLCGRCADMEAITRIARRHGLRVIEDCAHSIEAFTRGGPAGLLGDIGCFSFYATKNLTTGDGGMVITRSQRLHRRMRLVSLQGVTAGVWNRFLCGQNAYKVVSVGFRSSMNDIAASLGLVQLARLDERWRRREQLWKIYDRELRDLPLILPPPPARDSRHAYHLYTPLLVPDRLRLSRHALIAAMRAENIAIGVHYIPAHEQPFFRRRLRLKPDAFPNATFVGERTISLPLTAELSEQDVLHVCAALRRILRHYAVRGQAPANLRKLAATEH